MHLFLASSATNTALEKNPILNGAYWQFSCFFIIFGQGLVIYRRPNETTKKNLVIVGYRVEFD